MSVARPEVGREASPEDMKFKAPEAKNDLDDEIQKKNVERVESLNKQLTSVERDQQEIAANKMMSEKQKAEMMQRNEKTIAFLQKKLDKIPELPASEFDEIEEVNPEDVPELATDEEVLAEQAARYPKKAAGPETMSALDAQHETEKLRQERAKLEEEMANMGEDKDNISLAGYREQNADRITAIEAQMREVVAAQTAKPEKAARGPEPIQLTEEMVVKELDAKNAKDRAAVKQIHEAETASGVSWEKSRPTRETGAELKIEFLKKDAEGLREILRKSRTGTERLTEDEEKVIGADLQRLDRKIAKRSKSLEIEKTLQALEQKLGVKREDIDAGKVSGLARFGRGLRKLFNRDYAELSKVSQAKLDLEAEIAKEDLDEKENNISTNPANAGGQTARMMRAGRQGGRGMGGGSIKVR